MRSILRNLLVVILMGSGLLPLACSQNQANPMAPGEDLSADWLRRRTPTKTPTRTPTRTFTPAPVSPTFTPTPTFTRTPGTPTSTFTHTPTGVSTACDNPQCLTGTPTPTPTSSLCASGITLGDSAVGASTVNTFSSSTYAQRYNLAQAATLKKIWIHAAAPATVKVGLYGGSATSGWPSSLLWSSGFQVLTVGLNSFTVPDLPLAAGTYWLAYSGSASLTRTSGTSALRAVVALPFPCYWLACGYTSCTAPTCPTQGPGTPTCTPTPVCTPPPFGMASNQVVIYAEACP